MSLWKWILSNIPNTVRGISFCTFCMSTLAIGMFPDEWHCSKRSTLQHLRTCGPNCVSTTINHRRWIHFGVWERWTVAWRLVSIEIYRQFDGHNWLSSDPMDNWVAIEQSVPCGPHRSSMWRALHAWTNARSMKSCPVSPSCPTGHAALPDTIGWTQKRWWFCPPTIFGEASNRSTICERWPASILALMCICNRRIVRHRFQELSKEQKAY